MEDKCSEVQAVLEEGVGSLAAEQKLVERALEIAGEAAERGREGRMRMEEAVSGICGLWSLGVKVTVTKRRAL